MYDPSSDERRRMLAAMIAEALLLADELGLGLVGIALDGALEQLIAAPPPRPAQGTDALVH